MTNNYSKTDGKSRVNGLFAKAGSFFNNIKGMPASELMKTGKVDQTGNGKEETNLQNRFPPDASSIGQHPVQNTITETAESNLPEEKEQPEVEFLPLTEEPNPLAEGLIHFGSKLLTIPGCIEVMTNLLQKNRALRCPELYDVSWDLSMLYYSKQAFPFYIILRKVFFLGLDVKDPNSIILVKKMLTHHSAVLEDTTEQMEFTARMLEMVESIVKSFTTDAEINKFVGQFNGELVFPYCFHKINGKNFDQYPWMELTHHQSVVIAKKDFEPCRVAPAEGDTSEQADKFVEIMRYAKTVIEREYISVETANKFRVEYEPILSALIDYFHDCSSGKKVPKGTAKKIAGYHLEALQIYSDLYEKVEEQVSSEDQESDTKGKVNGTDQQPPAMPSEETPANDDASENNSSEVQPGNVYKDIKGKVLSADKVLEIVREYKANPRSTNIINEHNREIARNELGVGKTEEGILYAFIENPSQFTAEQKKVAVEIALKFKEKGIAIPDSDSVLVELMEEVHHTGNGVAA